MIWLILLREVKTKTRNGYQNDQQIGLFFKKNKVREVEILYKNKG